MNNLIFSNNNKFIPENRSSNNVQNKKRFDFIKIKNNTCRSLNEVEYFLNNLHTFKNYIKLYKILK